MAVQKVIKGMSRRAILMYAKLVTHSKWEVSHNEKGKLSKMANMMKA